MEYSFINQLSDGQSVVLVTVMNVCIFYKIYYFWYGIKRTGDENLYLSKDILRLLSFFVMYGVKHRVYVCY